MQKVLLNVLGFKNEFNKKKLQWEALFKETNK